jgi:hypothetical protein
VTTTPGEPFARASIFLGPLIEAHNFRLTAREYAEEIEGAAFAEYQRGDLALRLVWEPETRAVWLESARTTGGSIISRWIDIEWSISGARQPLDTTLDDERLERLARALGAFLAPADRGA